MAEQADDEHQHATSTSSFLTKARHRRGFSTLRTFLTHLNAREKGGDLSEDDQGVTDEQVIAAFQAVDDRLGDLEVPFVADVAVILEVQMIFFVGRRGVVGAGFASPAAAENRFEAGVVGAFLVVNLLLKGL